jgi:gas vesicle protein
MNIIETSIPDVSSDNIEKNKSIIADNIIENVYPLFDEVYKAKLQQVEQLKDEIKNTRERMKNEIQYH